MTETSTQMTAAGKDGRPAAAHPPTTAALAAPLPSVPPIEAHRAWPMISRLPVMLSVSIPLRGFRLTNFLNLSAGETIAGNWAACEDVPLKVGGLQIGSGEFETVEGRMALRLTRVA